MINHDDPIHLFRSSAGEKNVLQHKDGERGEL